MLWALAGLFLLAVAMSEEKSKPSAASSPQRAAVIALVRAEARRQGVPESIALAFAEVESNFNPAAQGDLGWAEKRPDKYRELVLDNPAFAHNPARTDARAWHAYGLFQLLAPYHTRPSEHPQVLLDPQVNATRGIAAIKGLLKKHGDDLAKARLAYTGNLKSNAATQERVLSRFVQAYQRWHDNDAGTLA